MVLSWLLSLLLMALQQVMWQKHVPNCGGGSPTRMVGLWKDRLFQMEGLALITNDHAGGFVFSAVVAHFLAPFVMRIAIVPQLQ